MWQDSKLQKEGKVRQKIVGQLREYVNVFKIDDSNCSEQMIFFFLYSDWMALIKNDSSYICSLKISLQLHKTLKERSCGVLMRPQKF